VVPVVILRPPVVVIIRPPVVVIMRPSTTIFMPQHRWWFQITGFNTLLRYDNTSRWTGNVLVRIWKLVD
jgi:hypothetical protein